MSVICLLIYLVLLYDAPKCKALWMQEPVKLCPIHYESYFGVFEMTGEYLRAHPETTNEGDLVLWSAIELSQKFKREIYVVSDEGERDPA